MNTNPGRRIFRDRPARVSATHLYDLGQSVKLRKGLGGNNLSAEVYRITGKLPVSNDLPQYRIRSDGEPYERMVAQDQLEPLAEIAKNPNASLIEKTFGVTG